MNWMKKEMLAACSLLLLLCTTQLLRAQDSEKAAKEIATAKEDAQSLERILKEIAILDSAYTPSFPRWQMDDPNLRLRVQAAFRNRGMALRKEDKITVTTMPDSQTVVDIKGGELTYGRLYSQTLLARDLRTDLLADAQEKVPPYGFRNRVSDETNPMARPAKPDWVAADFSLFGISLRFGNEWGLQGRMGDDELGYPFWSTGNTRLMLGYKSIRIGAWLPNFGGMDSTDRPRTIQLPGGETRTTRLITRTTRLLNGSDGIAGEFEFEWETIRINSDAFPYAAIGGSFAFGGLSGKRENKMTGNLDSLYYISTIVQGYYAFDFLFDQNRQNLNVHLGASYHKVNLGRAFVNEEEKYEVIDRADPESFIDPLIRIEYRNYRYDRFRVTTQFSRLFMVTGWAEIVPPFIYAEIKFSAVVFRTPRVWEHSNYVYGTLGFKFDF